MSKEVKNPCISECKVRDGVCLGCGRLREQIKGWKGMKKAEKKQVAEAAQQRVKAMKKARKKG
ncbi:DUF1289 domain-containing protein [Pseudomonas sp. NPDC007930]|uniref:DUF1289 domain-containing protein n=1 Tax=Pseudomonas sp. NPDC007930 TaxID=3364417 RepID=UPI0036F00E1D